MEAITSVKELITKAEQAEQNEDPEQAITLYHEAKNIDPANEYPYTRLMVLYRKLGRYREELKIINEGIKFFEKRYDALSASTSSKNKKIKQLSTVLMKRFGLLDSKGKSLYYPEPVGRWRKRKHTVENKLKR